MSINLIMSQLKGKQLVSQLLANKKGDENE